MHTEPDIPIVALYNNLEVAFKFLHRSNDGNVVEQRRFRGDRGIFWLGPSKMLVVTTKVPDAEYICQRWGYSDTHVYTPRHTTNQLSLDIMHDRRLLEKIVTYAGPKKTIQLIPYASTPELYVLARHLNEQSGLKVILSESPMEANLWVRDYIDTKAGFRSLISQWIPEDDIIPWGFICQDVTQAAHAVHWFNRKQLGAVVKADSGESGLGHLIFTEPGLSFETLSGHLTEDLFLSNDLIVVDQLISSDAQLSPSLELFVPADGRAPAVTYVSRQMFSDFGHFSGVLISRELTRADWYERLVQYGLHIANKLQALGYAGHFDIDTIVDDTGHLFLLEINARRTGGTYVHEFATMTFGKEYLDRVSLLCSNSVKCGEINCLEGLVESLDGLLFPIERQDRGVVITVTSSLSKNEFGCILVAPDEQDILKLKEEMLARLEDYTEKKIRV